LNFDERFFKVRPCGLPCVCRHILHRALELTEATDSHRGVYKVNLLSSL